MMIDEDVASISPASVHRILKEAGVLDKRPKGGSSKKGTGFIQPTRPHQHWHIDISYLNLGGTFYYCCSVLDGYSRAIVHWEIRSSLPEDAIEIILQKAKEKYPGHKTRVISDNGPQFIANDFKSFIRQAGMTHVRTSPYYPQSNGKIERYHRTMKGAFGLYGTQNIDDARVAMTKVVEHYNTKRLHYSLKYITPHDVLNQRGDAIWEMREKRIREAKKRRQDYWKHLPKEKKEDIKQERQTKAVA